MKNEKQEKFAKMLESQISAIKQMNSGKVLSIDQAWNDGYLRALEWVQRNAPKEV